MITYQVEPYSSCIVEMKLLYPQHYDELSVTKGFQLEPNYQKYYALEAANALHVITCRKDAKLIGYIMFIVDTHMHYMSCLTAFEDIYFIIKEERRGRTGIKLFQFAEQYLKSINVNRVIYSTKTHLDNSKLFEYLGYTLIEKVYSKTF